MVFFLATVCSAGILPILRLDQDTSRAFDQYVAKYENGPDARFRATHKFQIDSLPESKGSALAKGEMIVEVIRSENVAHGHIDQLYGAIHIPGIRADGPPHAEL